MMSPLLRRLAAAGASLILLMGGSMLLASPASANQVWHQSIGRATADAPCPADSDAELAIGWTSWAPSWEQWPGEGRGGFVCSRQITWAFDEPPVPSVPGVVITCLQYTDTLFIDFAGESHVAGPTPTFDAVDCLTRNNTFFGLGLVYAPGGSAEADSLCAEFFPTYTSVRNFGYDVYYCVAAGF